jgi:hypothetical protein
MVSPPARPTRAGLVPIGFWAMLAAWWLLYALVAYWTPIQGEDWIQLGWLMRYRPIGVDDALHFLRVNPTLGEVAGQLGVAYPWFHILVSPTVIVLFVVGLYTLAFNRLPSPRSSRDTLVLAILHAMVWMGAPRVGVTLGHRPHVGHFIYGLTALIWVLSFFRRAGDEPPRGKLRTAGTFILAIAAGASNHHIALMGLGFMVAAIITRRRAGRAVPAWMPVAAVGVTIGLVCLFLNPTPYFAALGRRGWSTILTQLVLFLTEGAETIALCSLTAFVLLVRSRVRNIPMPVPTIEELRWMATCFVVGFALVAIGLFGPRWGDPAMFAPAVLFAAGGAVAMARLVEDVWIRRGAIVVVILVHVVIAFQMVRFYHQGYEDMQVRMAQLRAAPPGSTAAITPYRKVETTFWFFGEDLGWAATREYAALGVFKLRDITFDRETGIYEPSTGFEMKVSLVFDPPFPDAEVQASIGTPMATSLTVARSQWLRAIYELDKHHHVISGDLEITNLDFPGRNGRPIYAGRLLPGKGLVEPRATWRQPDPLQRMSFSVRWKSLRMRVKDLFVVGMGDSLPVKREGERVFFVPLWAGSYTLIACDDNVCLAVETAWVRY